MHINWASLGVVTGVSLVAAITLIVLFSLGVHTLGKRAEASERGASTTASLTLAITCFGLFAAMVIVGVLLIAAPSIFG